MTARTRRWPPDYARTGPRALLRGSCASPRSRCRARGCWTLPAAAAATPAFSLRGGTTSWPSTATSRRWPPSPACARIETRALDLETGSWPLAGERFDAIVVANYLYRPLFPHLLAALADDGLLLYETFARGNEAFGRPSNPEFLLAPGELLAVAARGLTVVAFEQGFVSASPRGAVVERLAAVGPRRPWPAAAVTSRGTQPAGHVRMG